ncbi:MAG: hypothetical protein V7L31_32330 [Nostoc sp.]|uniref:hypothetical protein n=1 Tax=Nostoc sp. TaxID=1180 RepID=UPI002FEFE606
MTFTRFWTGFEEEIGQVASWNTYNFVKALIKRSLFWKKKMDTNNRNGRRKWTQIRFDTTFGRLFL